MGAVGLPEFDNAPPEKRPEKGLLGIRKALGVYANLRPVRAYASQLDSSPLKNHLVEGTDMIIVRELTGGIYYGTPRGIIGDGAETRAVNTMTYTRAEIERVARMAFHLARARRKKVTSVDKSNVLEISQLWRRVVIEVAQRIIPMSSSITSWWITARCSWSSTRKRFDVVLTENMFGDILSDEGAVLAGSIGMLPSASIGDQQSVRRLGRAVRAGARLGPRHRRTEQSQSAGRHRLGGRHARLQFRFEGRSRRGGTRPSKRS